MKLWCREYGSDHPEVVVLLHGLLGSGENWHSIAKVLAETRRVLVPDLRNHGRSPHDDLNDYPSMASDVLELIEEYRVDRSICIGHSMGGKVAMRLALDQPGRFTRLIVEDMVPGETFPRYLAYISAMQRIDLATVSSRREADDRLSDDVADEVLRLFLLKNLERTDSGYRWRANLDVLAASYDSLWQPLEESGGYDGPALFIRGAESDTVEGERTESIYRYFPDAELETVEDAGHWVHATRPEPFLEILGGFIGG